MEKQELFSEDAKFVPSERAEDILDHILDETSEVTQQEKKEKLEEVSVKEALKQEGLLKQAESNRMQSRVLFITKNPAVLDSDSIEQAYFKNLGEVFDEVHVIITGLKKRSADTVRLASKVWLYPSVSNHFFEQPFDIFATAKQQLQFTDGFRPDIIVALDPFESGVAGHFIARKYKRAFQVQITEDFYLVDFANAQKNNTWRLRFAKYVLKRVKSVRVDTDILKQKIAKRHKKIKDLALLPRHFNVQEIIKHTSSESAKDLYAQFSFTILFIGSLSQDSTLFRALDATRKLLRTPSIGFVVIGDGSAKSEFQERAKILGIANQVIFKPKVDDIAAHMKAADILLCTETNGESEDLVIKAAAVGLPIIMARTPLREDLFTDGIDSFLCEPEDTQGFTHKLLEFLNSNALRTQFTENARDVVVSRIEEDPQQHRFALRDSIESVLYLEQVQNQKKDTTQSPQPESLHKKETNGIEMKMPEPRHIASE